MLRLIEVADIDRNLVVVLWERPFMLDAFKPSAMLRNLRLLLGLFF